MKNRNKEIEKFFNSGISKEAIINFFYKTGSELTKKEKQFLNSLN